MENRFEALVRSLIDEEKLLGFTLSNSVDRRPEAVRKVVGRPIVRKGEPAWQFEFHTGSRVLHDNLKPENAARLISAAVPATYRQAVLHASDASYHARLSAKGTLRISRQPATGAIAAAPTRGAAHNRQKQYILADGVRCEFLVRLGVMTAEGRVVAARYDKFRQINRFLEMVADVADELPASGQLTIVDFGCGKSYLTFVLHHYFRNICSRDVRIIGLDVKADVVEHCNTIADELACERLRFEVGDIADYSGVESADMVVSLHACDTATDDALAKAVQWNASVILAVPCCQHEMFRKIQNNSMRPMLKHGIVRERLAALVTDTIRAQLLEAAGYTVQILEFIETEHTPKNLLIRAVRRGGAPLPSALAEYERFRDFWQVRPYLEQRLKALGVAQAADLKAAKTS